MAENPNQPSNFSFLTVHWAFLHSDAHQVEHYALRDPRAAAIYARRTLELSLRWLFTNDLSLKHPYEKSLAAMIHEPTFANAIRQGLFHDIKFIHRLGNVAAHGDQYISTQESLKAAMALHAFLGWLSRVYTRENAAPQPFQTDWLPQAEVHTSPLTVQQLEKIQDELVAKDAAAAVAHEKLTRTETELAELKAQLTALQQLKQVNQKTIGSGEYTEAQTRELMIDVMLREAGWDPKAANVIEFEVRQCMPTANGERNGAGLCGLCVVGRRWQTGGAGGGEEDPQSPGHRQAPGGTVRALPGTAIWPAPADLLLQRLHYLAVGRQFLSAARGAGLRHARRIAMAHPSTRGAPDVERIATEAGNHQSSLPERSGCPCHGTLWPRPQTQKPDRDGHRHRQNPLVDCFGGHADARQLGAARVVPGRPQSIGATG
ncbi:MAG: DUF4145 domain-containing protein [Nitrosomonas sp.]|nr:DUF4145 domain-containing protein [Nitrosomonas sp.]